MKFIMGVRTKGCCMSSLKINALMRCHTWHLWFRASWSN